MEKNKQNLQEDAFVKKYLKEIELQKPALNFTENVMSILAKESKIKVVKNEPLISKNIWFLVASFVGVCFYFVLKAKKSIGISFPEVDFSFISKLEMPNFLSSVSVSNLMLLVFGLFTLFFFVQIFFLKNHFAKRFEV